MADGKPFLDPLEDRVIFRMSRFFYHALIALSGLVVVGGVLFLVSGLIPTIKETVVRPSNPPPIKITADAVKSAMQERADARTARPTAKTPIQKKQEPPSEEKEDSQQEKDKRRFKAAIERVRALLPDPPYRWKSTETYSRPSNPYLRPVPQTTHVGIEQRLRDLLSHHETLARRADALEDLAAVLEQFPLAERLEPLKTFIAMSRDAEKARLEAIKRNAADYKKALAAAETDYEASVAGRQIKRYTGILVTGYGIASIAMLGMFLVLLSIQREVKKLSGAASALQNPTPPKPQTLVCGKCGQTLQPASRFCDMCGTPL